MSGQQVNNRSGSKQVGFKNRSGSKQVGFGCYSNRSDSVPGQHQLVTDRVRVIAASGKNTIHCCSLGGDARTCTVPFTVSYCSDNSCNGECANKFPPSGIGLCQGDFL
ncbi:hypothetical protein GQ457_01G013770 [Hibiscus cannabinus]